MAISKRLRYEILRRDNHACRYCGAAAPDVKLVIDHVVPEALGGKTEPSNLVTSCDPCNSGKTSTVPDAPLVANVESDALRWARAIEIATIALRVERDERDAIRAKFIADWKRWTFTDREGKKKTVEIPPNWPDTVDQLIGAGLDNEDDCTDADLARWTSRARTGANERGEEFEGEVPVAAIAVETVAELREILWRCENALHRILERLPQDLVAAARATAVADLDHYMPSDYTERDVLIGTAFNAGEALDLGATVGVPI